MARGGTLTWEAVMTDNTARGEVVVSVPTMRGARTAALRSCSQGSMPRMRVAHPEGVTSTVAANVAVMVSVRLMSYIPVWAVTECSR